VNVLEAILNVLYEILIALQSILNDSDVTINVTEPISNVKDLYYMLLLAIEGAEWGHFPKLLVEAKTQLGFRYATSSWL
jgi:hypothetical protein